MTHPVVPARGTAPPGPATSWSAHLDALEEWLRRLDSAVADGTGEPSPPTGTPEGEAGPTDLLRAHALLARMRTVEDLARARRAELRRAHTYAQH